MFLWLFIIIFVLTKSFCWCNISSINGERAALFNNVNDKCGALRGSILKSGNAHLLGCIDTNGVLK